MVDQLPPEPHQIPAAQVDAVRDLVASMPGADAVLTQHISDNGEVLPYVLINDLARRYASTVQRLGSDAARPLAAALEQLAASPHQDVRGLLTEFFSGLAAHAGRAELAAIAALRPIIGPIAGDRLASVLNDYGVGGHGTSTSPHIAPDLSAG